MKKRRYYGLLLVLLCFPFVLWGCNEPNLDSEIVKQAKQTLKLPETTITDLDLVTELNINGKMVKVAWETSDLAVINSEGQIFRSETDCTVTLTATLTYQKASDYATFEVTVLSLTAQEVLDLAKDSLQIPVSTTVDLDLIDSITIQNQIVSVTWESNDEAIVTKQGKVQRSYEEDQEVTLIANLSFQGEILSVTFEVTVLAYTPFELMEEVLEELAFPTVLTENLVLPGEFPYGITATWASSDETVLTKEGILLSNQAGKTVSLTVTLSLRGVQMERTFYFSVKTAAHLLLNRLQDFNESNMTNLVKTQDYVGLTEGATQGEYLSEEFAVTNVKSLVGSWSAETGSNRTVELLIRVKVDGVWSDFLSYSVWGLGLQNKGQSDASGNNVAKMSYDELIINNNKYGSFVQYKIILRRSSPDVETPKLRLVAMALENAGYSYPVDASALPDTVDYNVPQLNQNIVPEIGNSICSPTSVTMLLKYKGYSFSDKDIYEHRYIAGLAKDYGHNIFGNWVYNVAVMGAMGEIGYVKRMYSLDELRWHLANVGPVAASVKGNMEGLYTTNGHLIVIRGYKYIGGNLYFIVNDPNLKNVYYEYKASTIQSVWRNIAYVIE